MTARIENTPEFWAQVHAAYNAAPDDCQDCDMRDECINSMAMDAYYSQVPNPPTGECPMNTSNETMVTKNRWVVNCTTFYLNGDKSSGMVAHFATKAEAVAEYRLCLRLARQDKSTIKVVRFGDLDHGVKGKYGNRLYSVTCERMTMPAYMW